MILTAIGGDVAPTAKRMTQTIPIVFITSADPEKQGLVASLARPGGNATGVTFLQDELASKRLELLKEAAGRTSEVGFLWNPDRADNEERDAQRAAQALGVRLHRLGVRGAGDIDAAFEAARQARADALYVVSSRHTVLNVDRIVGFAKQARLPLAGGWGAWAMAGGLLSYGPRHRRHGAARRRPCRQDPPRREARRPAGRAADEVRAGDQPRDRAKPSASISRRPSSPAPTR